MKVLAMLCGGGDDSTEEPRPHCTFENGLGLCEYLQSHGCTYVVSDSKKVPEEHIADTEILITTSFYPIPITDDVFGKAKKLQLCITAGIGSRHIDLNAAADSRVYVLEVGSPHVDSIAEHLVMSILLLVRNIVPAHEMIERDGWQISQIARDAFDLKGKVVGTIGVGYVGCGVLERLVPFGCEKLLYYDTRNISQDAPDVVKNKVLRVDALKELVSQCDVVTVNCPSHEGTRLINEDLLKSFKPGAWLVNAAHGDICDKGAIAKAVQSGRLNGYGTVPRYCGLTIDAQKRYAAIIESIIESYRLNGSLEDIPQDKDVRIVVGSQQIEWRAQIRR